MRRSHSQARDQVLPWSCRWLTALAMVVLGANVEAQVSNIKHDQEVVFFQSIARRASPGPGWELEIHGSVYEPEKRRLGLALLRRTLALGRVKLDAMQRRLLQERARLFMVDNERGKTIVVRVAGRNIPLNKSRANGRFSCSLGLSETELQALRCEGLQAVLPESDPRCFGAQLNLIEDTGVTVISDVDDTIKLTQVRSRRATLRNTFLEPFKPVPEMAQLFGGAAMNPDVQFWYVSASPWQLFLPLSEFIRAHGFPAGIFSLKDFRLKDRTLLTLFAGPEKYKLKVIAPQLERFPQRQFVLVGDSGERDPEIYAALARRYPGQVKHIFLRDVTGEGAQEQRYKNLFADLPTTSWTIFREPSEIAEKWPWNGTNDK